MKRFFLIALIFLNFNSSGVDAITFMPGAGQCLKDACGPYQPQYDEQATRPASQLARIDADYERIFAPQLDRLKGLSQWKLKDRLRLIDYVSKMDLKGVQLSDDLRISLNMERLLAFSKKYFGRGMVELSTTAESGMRLNRSRALRYATIEGIPDPEKFLNAFEALLNTDMNEYYDLSTYMKISTFHDLYGRDTDFEKFLRGKLDFIANWKRKVKGLNPYIDPPQPAVVRKFQASGLTDADSELFLTELADSKLIDYSYSESVAKPAFLAIKLNVEDEVQEKIKALKAVLPQVEREQNDQYQNELAARVIRGCHYHYKSKMRSLPLEKELTTFQDRALPRILDAAKRAMSRWGFSHDIPALKEYVWKMPESYEVTTDYMKISLEDEVETRLDYLGSRERFWTDLKKGEPQAVAYALYEFLLLRPDELQNPYSEIKTLCDRVEPDEPVDNVYFKNKTAHIGWRSVLYPRTFQYYLGHEIGHIVYHLESNSSKLSGKLKCLRQRHRGLNDGPEDKYLSEDFADLFGVQLEKEFLVDSSHRPAFCYWQSNPYNRPYQGLASLIRMDDNVHSAALFRLVSVAMEMGNLPNSCKAMIKVAGADDLLETCLDK